MSKPKWPPLKYGLALDPGSRRSGWVFFKSRSGQPLGGLQILAFSPDTDNVELRRRFCTDEFSPAETRLITEFPKPRGQLTSADEMQMMFEVGRMVDQFVRRGGRWSMVFRQDIKMHLCGNAGKGGKDPNVRQALIDRFGGEERAIGGVKCRTCNGRKTKGFVTLGCATCGGSGRVAGVRGEKKCPDCGGKGEKRGDPATCDRCRGSGWQSPPGPLHGVSSHVWPALAVAAYWTDNPKVVQRIGG